MNARRAPDCFADHDWNSRVFAVFETPDVEIVGIRLDSPADVSAAVWQLLSRDEQRRAERFRYPQHRQQYVLTRAGLRRLLAERLHLPARAIEFVENSYGKPRLSPAHAPATLEFNLSHSENLAVYAFTRRHAVGVDIERIRQIPDAGDLAERFFSPSEIESIRSLPIEQRSLAFLTCWTRKEAFIKALGLGLSYPLDAFDVTIEPHIPARITRIEGRVSELAHWRLHAFTPYPHYMAAVAYRAGGDAAWQSSQAGTQLRTAHHEQGAPDSALVH
ncbi:4'-phosphopantetheinyl transferase superfamily protein [Bradyrhizobium symbiodeficiens]|uniref:4'-phosphopantetheinyl transferase family protein n=1 Tax=Bradyrhizobium symbiodeficiens TaxID=1404367 RepID=UPI0030CE02C3